MATKSFFLSFSLNVDDADAVVGVGVDVVDVVDDRTIFWIQCYQTFFSSLTVWLSKLECWSQFFSGILIFVRNAL
jgi:hypothetical protein